MLMAWYTSMYIHEYVVCLLVKAMWFIFFNIAILHTHYFVKQNILMAKKNISLRI